MFGVNFERRNEGALSGHLQRTRIAMVLGWIYGHFPLFYRVDCCELFELMFQLFVLLRQILIVKEYRINGDDVY